MRTALAPADAQEEEEEEACQADHDHKEPICRRRRMVSELGGPRNNRDGQGTQAASQGAMEPVLRQGTICKAPQRTCNYSLVLRAQDWGAATEGHQPQDSLLQSPHQRPYPQFKQTKQRARGSLAGATNSSLQEGEVPQPIPEPQKNTAGTSHSSPLPMPQNLFNQPRPPQAHSQATRCHRMGQV